MKPVLKFVIPLILLAVLAAACTSTQTPSAPAASPTSVSTPTPTQPPLAININGVGITLDEYQQELLRLQDAQTALGTTSTPDEQKQKVVDDFTDQLLLAQGAAQAGFTVDDATLQQRLDQLAAKMGGQDQLTAWETTNHYTDATFKDALRRSIAVAWQRDQIINSVPTTADQVHARQILVQTQETANELLAQLKAGADFATLALTYDPVTGGDLGWFPQGYLTQPEVEAAAFALQPGQFSDVIKSAIGYHIIYVIERDPQHQLTPDARRVLQEKKLTEWLDAAKAASQVTTNIP